ncbi:hypothetical protein CEXT_761581 [Caerostris extrusa]|uniref:Uncharacterized protein n=1 Tax=Caerostris extrusa TaxID=172846 RepID=A0AAV4UIA1_CAEEX|nr:hypothetical protein CEXT_761581 [Caerostris extrusa]
MNPNSVLKVKQPRRKYKQMLKMKTKERRRSKISPDCRNLRCKSNKKIQSQTPRKDSDTEHEMAMSPKSFSDAQTQVTDEDFLTQFNGRLRSIKKNAETQWEDIHLKHQHKSREFDTLKKETNIFQKILKKYLCVLTHSYSMKMKIEIKKRVLQIPHLHFY